MKCWGGKAGFLALCQKWNPGLRLHSEGNYRKYMVSHCSVQAYVLLLFIHHVQASALSTGGVVDSMYNTQFQSEARFGYTGTRTKFAFYVKLVDRCINVGHTR